MDAEKMSLEDRCEHLMNVVVETRKRFSKMCTDYQQKSSLMENKMLNLKVETIANCKIKSKTQTPDIPFDELVKDMELFKQEVLERENRVEEIRNKIKNTERVVVQVKSDHVRQKLEKPITTEVILACAKNRK